MEGFSCSFYKVRNIIDMQGLRSVHRKKRQRSLADSRKARNEGQAKLTRILRINAPSQVPSNDICNIRTGKDSTICASSKNVKIGFVLTESMSERMKAELFVIAIRKALRQWDISTGCIFHRDRGSQHTSERVMNLLAKEGLRQRFHV